jgi:hypothetical protein
MDKKNQSYRQLFQCVRAGKNTVTIVTVLALILTMIGFKG